MQLTTRQQEVLDLIADHVRYLGYPPTAREIADALGLAIRIRRHDSWTRWRKRNSLNENQTGHGQSGW